VHERIKLRYKTFEKCHFKKRERREILKMDVSERFILSVEMTKWMVFQRSRGRFSYPVLYGSGFVLLCLALIKACQQKGKNNEN
jgi:hypothetical protein